MILPSLLVSADSAALLPALKNNMVMQNIHCQRITPPSQQAMWITILVMLVQRPLGPCINFFLRLHVFFQRIWCHPHPAPVGISVLLLSSPCRCSRLLVVVTVAIVVTIDTVIVVGSFEPLPFSNDPLLQSLPAELPEPTTQIQLSLDEAMQNIDPPGKPNVLGSPCDAPLCPDPL